MSGHEVRVFQIGAILTMAAVFAAAPHGAGQERSRPATSVAFDIPEQLRTEHDDLSRDLGAATRLPGQTGQAAVRVARLKADHFDKEEEFVLPPLGLLGPLSQGKVTANMRDAIPLTERLRSGLPVLLQEHEAILGALSALDFAAREERHRDVVDFVDRLKRHLRREEQILYPAVLLVGELLKLHLLK